MAKTLAVSLACSLIMGFASRGLAGAQDAVRPSLSPDTIIRVGDSSSGKVFQKLLAIARQNHVPMGIVVGKSGDDALCENMLTLKPGNSTVSDLIAALKSGAPGYEGHIRDGVLEIRPQISPDNVSAFLDLKISRFQSPPGPLIAFGTSLWMGIRGVIAPGEGTDTDTLFSLSAETVPGLNITNQTVNSILNTIARSGGGGVWVLHGAQLKVLSDRTAMPYEIHGYVGEDNLESMIKCSTK